MTLADLLREAWQQVQEGELETAERTYGQAIRHGPPHASAWLGMAIVLIKAGRLADAIAAADTAIRLDPTNAHGHNLRGIALALDGRLHAATAALRRATLLRPDDANFQNDLGKTLRDVGLLEEAEKCLRQAIQINPAHAGALNNLGNTLGDQGRLEEALAAYQRALQLDPNYAAAHSNLLCTLHYMSEVGPAEIANAHAEFDKQHAAALTPLTFGCESMSSGDRPLRLGLISPDFGCHPVGQFLRGLLLCLDQRECHTIGYSNRSARDEITKELRAAASEWRDVIAMGDEVLAQQIQKDRVDILIDLAGHTAGNRLFVFARKPAPIQITWLGYVGTTGLSAMDFLLADGWQVPAGDERHYRERILRLPDGYVCFAPPRTAPPVGPLPAIANGHVTFGCFNNPAKINPNVIQTWAEILRAVPSARLVLKYRGFDDPGCRGRYLRRFAEGGVASERLDLLGWSPHAEHLAQYQKVDVALDTFPYSGGLTTCEALWMGVPVITFPGRTFAGRHASGHLSNVGFTDTIANDQAHYVALAVSLASQVERLATWRRELRDRTAASPLCDGPRFARGFLETLRGAQRLMSQA